MLTPLDMGGFLGKEHPTGTASPFLRAGRGGEPIIERAADNADTNAVLARDLFGIGDWLQRKLNEAGKTILQYALVGVLGIALVYLGAKALTSGGGRD